jgi:hypothetical protein
MMLSSPPFQVTAMQRSFSARTALMLGKALTTLIPSGLAGPIPIEASQRFAAPKP